MRAKKHPEHENHERWLVSYADFITLLFAFFVVLYATSTQNQSKQKDFESSIKAQLHMSGLIEGSGQGGYLGNIIDPIDLFQKRNVGNGELRDFVEKLLQKNLTEEERKLAVGGVRHDATGVRISLAASNFFPSGGAKLRRQALGGLDKIAKILKNAPHKVVIEGHTDNQVLSGGDFETNWELGSVRATQVVRYLIKIHGFDAARLGAASYADTRPIVPNDTPENRAKNRRIEILIVNNDLEGP